MSILNLKVLMRLVSLVAVLMVVVDASRAIAQPTDAAMQALAGKIEAGFMKGDSSALQQVFDEDAFLDRITRNVPAKDDLRQGFTAGIKSKTPIAALSEKIIGAIADNAGTYHFLGVSGIGGNRGMLFSLHGADGINYHNLIPVVGADGSLRIVDMFIAISGETLSSALRRTYLQAALSAEGDSKDLPEGLKAMKDMVAARAAGEHKKVQEIYAALSPKIKKDPMLSMLRILSAQQLDDATYIAALDESRQSFDEPITIDLMSIDAFALKGRFDDSIAAIDRIQKAVVNDPALLMLKSQINSQKGAAAEALANAKAAAAAEPANYQFQDNLLSLALVQKQFDIVKSQLELMTEKFGFSFQADLNNAEAFAEFKKSDAYKKWVEGLKK